ncbi:hypothetical protein AGOR_G00169040 [Albula goreensis]|uniref:Uncharacterized protein n=1 Tax=Albula goreensis TaxID=1534307 RepID=A0A8T3D212_9TELE|nr:hypothetical protein AGOR_G00169040 [Albula goreensis]
MVEVASASWRRSQRLRNLSRAGPRREREMEGKGRELLVFWHSTQHSTAQIASSTTREDSGPASSVRRWDRTQLYSLSDSTL